MTAVRCVECSEPLGGRDAQGAVIGVFDVGYADDAAVVGCVSLAEFEDVFPVDEWLVEVRPVGPYVPGQFWMRELDPLLRGVAAATGDPGESCRVHQMAAASKAKPGRNFTTTASANW